MAVVIPCYNEPDLNHTLQSLADCEPPDGAVEVLVVINSGENASDTIRERNRATLDKATELVAVLCNDRFELHLIHIDNFPAKHAGVGLARKIGMDESARRFGALGRPDGVIVCLDADCTVAPNYFRAIDSHFAADPATPACSIYFEHPLSGPEPPEFYEGIIQYELFLRYYIQGLRFSGYPYAYHTIGSSMAVRSQTYLEQGGMNKRKAGEDFYFLHKIMPLGHFSEINTTTVYPSPRISLRVPFGTGKAIYDWVSRDKEELKTYDPVVFREITLFLDRFLGLYPKGSEEQILADLPEAIRSWLETQGFAKKLEEIRKNSSTPERFHKRLLRWFNGFRVLKLVHFYRDQFYQNISVTRAARLLLELLGEEEAPNDAYTLLSHYRRMDRGNGNPVSPD